LRKLKPLTGLKA